MEMYPKRINASKEKSTMKQSISQANNPSLHNHTNNPAVVPSFPFFPCKILYVWALVFLGMVVYAFTWFSLGLPLIYFVNAIRANMTFTDPMWNQVVDFVMFMFEINPIIALLGWLIYGILNSARRDIDTWQVP